jgi:hypothetical protein
MEGSGLFIDKVLSMTRLVACCGVYELAGGGRLAGDDSETLYEGYQQSELGR